jgi:hypothetical protein
MSTKDLVVFYTMKLDCKHIEPILDDDKYLITATIKDETEKEIPFTFRVSGAQQVPACFYWGGLSVFSNLDPEMLQRAMALGLEFLARTNQIQDENLRSHTPEEE